MVQTRSNSSPVEDLASGQASGGDNGSAEDSSRGTIPEAPQGPAGGDASPEGEGVQLPGGQEAPKNPGAMGVGDSIEVDAPPDNEGSGREEEIATEIERLKREQKKAQMKSEPHKYNIGDFVYLNSRNIESTRPSKKLDWKFYRLYNIRVAQRSNQHCAKLIPLRFFDAWECGCNWLCSTKRELFCYQRGS